MTTLDRTTLHGFVPAVVTPFDTDGTIVEADFRSLVDTLIGFGATAICVAGDNGESWTLGPDERRRLTEIAVETAGSRAAVITGCSAPTAAASIAYARAADAGGAAALLAMPQTYVLKATRSELLARFTRLSDAVSLPIVAYNSPRRAGIELSLDDLDAIMGVAPIIGIKESHRDFFHLTHLIERFADRLAIMVGPSHYILPGLALGAAGFIATGPELMGATAGRLVEIARAAPGDEYRATHMALTRLYEMLMGTGTWPSSIKAALNLQGHPAGVPREPVLPLGDADLERVRATLAGLDLI
jgi:4-hydroxy-tetrahydrodipicolinate synthase